MRSIAAMPESGLGRAAAVDSHAHVFVRGLPLVPDRRHAPDFDATLAEYLGLLDANGLSHAVLVQPSFLGTDNSFMLEALRAKPSRLRGVAVVQPDIAEEALHTMAADGVCGIRLNLVGKPVPPLAQTAWQRLFGRLRALDWHVEVHCDSAELQRACQPVLAAGCRLVVDHFGRPAAEPDAGFAWLLRQGQDGGTWVKLSAAYRNWPDATGAQARTAAHRLLAAFGPDRLLWGSDWPHTQHRERADYASALRALAAWVPDAAERRRILVDTPGRLFQFQRGDKRHAA